jgi:hypothetical protein
MMGAVDKDIGIPVFYSASKLSLVVEEGSSCSMSTLHDY